MRTSVNEWQTQCHDKHGERSDRRILRYALVLLATLPGVSTAQAVTFAPVVSSVDHKFLTDRRGWQLGMEVPLLDRVVHLRLQFEGSSGSGDHVGAMCSDVSDPLCPLETIDDRSTFHSTTLAVAVQLVSRGRVAFAVVPQLTGGRVSVRMSGRTTQEEAEGSRDYRGVGIGAELLLRRAPASLWSLTLGGRFASLSPVRHYRSDTPQALSGEFAESAGYVGVRFGR